MNKLYLYEFKNLEIMREDTVILAHAKKFTETAVESYFIEAFIRASSLDLNNYVSGVWNPYIEDLFIAAIEIMVKDFDFIHIETESTLAVNGTLKIFDEITNTADFRLTDFTTDLLLAFNEHFSTEPDD